jgi:opacity protein-like surface antigen
MKNLLLGFVALMILGCASGSAVVVGQARPPIEDWDSVAVTTQMPDGAEEIALVQASSDSGWNEQQSVDYAIVELKKQAAKVGANTVVIDATDTTLQVLTVGTDVYSSNAQVVKGMAVFVGRAAAAQN